MKEEEGRRKQVEQREDEVSAITYLGAPVCIYIYGVSRYIVAYLTGEG